MALEGSGSQFSKLVPTTKMALQVYSSNFSTLKDDIDEKQYNDPIWIREVVSKRLVRKVGHVLASEEVHPTELKVSPFYCLRISGLSNTINLSCYVSQKGPFRKLEGNFTF
jgi:hypothetical protein